MKKSVWILWFSGVGLMLATSGCDDDDNNEDPGPVCEDDTCSGHGTCEVVDDELVCTCDDGYGGAACNECASGYQDNDGDDVCAPDCETAGLSCGELAHCDDSAGEATCVCDAGAQDNDGDGVCAPDCEHSGLDCGDVECDDSTGTARCLCPEGYQDNDSNGSCEANCDTAALDCHGNGECDDSTGTARCACEAGYSRSDCSACRSSYYQDNDGDGVCEPTCYFSETEFSCDENQWCSHASGTAQCVCNDGYQDNDGDGTCLPTCHTAQTAEEEPLVCPDPNVVCDDSTGVATCHCEAGYVDDAALAGDDCLSCAAGFQDNGDRGICRPDCASAVADGLTCALGCDDSSGVALCSCAAGEQDNDGDGTCEADCATAALTCDAAEHRSCDDSSGHAFCACDDGTYDDGMGTCRSIGAGDGDDCSDMIELLPTTTVFYADMTGVDADYPFSCDMGGLWPRDMYYRVPIAPGESRTMTFTVERVDTTGVSFTPVVALRAGESCATATELDCGIGADASVTATLEGGDSGADYYLLVGMADGGAPATRATVRVQNHCDAGSVYSPIFDSCVDDPCEPSNPCVSEHRSRCRPDASTETPSYDCACNIGYVEDGTGSCVPDESAEGDSCTDVIALDISTGEGEVSGSTIAATSAGEGSCRGDRPARDRIYGFVLDDRTRMTLNLVVDPAYDGLLHLRGACNDAATEVTCVDRGPTGGAESMSRTLDPGTYYLFVDGWNSRPDDRDSDGTYTLEYAFHTNPCADEEAQCPGAPVCTPTRDWSDFNCECETDGHVLFDGDCVEDPCDPDPCGGDDNLVCEPDYGAGTAECVCGGIYVSDGEGGCTLAEDAEWTILWYVAMDNNLYYQTGHELMDIRDATFSPDVRVVALIDRFNEDSAYYAEFGPGSTDVIVDLGDTDSGDWTTLRDFGVWGVENYPAQHYVLVVSDHGGAWRNDQPTGQQQVPALRAICWDDRSETPNTGIGISNGELAQAYEGITDAAGGKLDLIIYDACLMGEWEVANVTAPYAEYMIAAPTSTYGFMLREGAWTDWLDTLVAGVDTLSPLEVGEEFIDNYRATMATDPQYVTTGFLTDLDAVPELNEAVSDFADALVADESDEFYATLDDVRRTAQQVGYHELVDMQDFARLVSQADSASPDVVSAADALITELNWAVVYGYSNIDRDDWNPHYGSVGLAGQNGLTVYLPGQFYAMAEQYTDVGAVWSAQSSWDEFLATFLTGEYYRCTGAEPVLDYTGGEYPATLRLTECCQEQFFVQTFQAPGVELHGVEIAVIKTSADGEEHHGFYFAIRRPGHGNVWGPAHWEIPRDTDEPQFLCLASLGLPTEPGEELQIVVGGGDPYPGFPGGFSTPIRWPIEYADGAGDEPPYAEGRAYVTDGDGSQSVAEYNGDGIEGTFWFRVY